MNRSNVAKGLLLATAAPLVVYFGVYVWARCTGVFIGAVETWAPFGNKPSNQYEISPLGHHAVDLYPDPSRPENESQRLRERLWGQSRNSLRLWPWYSWLAALEEASRHRPQPPSKGSE